MLVIVPKIAPPKIINKWMFGMSIDSPMSVNMTPILSVAKLKRPHMERVSSSKWVLADCWSSRFSYSS